jgi:Ion channel
VVFVYLSTVIIFVVAQFDRLQSGNRGERFFALFSLSIFPLMMIVFFAMVYKTLGLVEGNAMVKRPLDFLYFSMVTWTTLGYGDLKPSLDSRMFAASEALLGYIFMGLYIAVIFHLISARANKAG